MIFVVVAVASISIVMKSHVVAVVPVSAVTHRILCQVVSMLGVVANILLHHLFISRVVVPLPAVPAQKSHQ